MNGWSTRWKPAPGEKVTSLPVGEITRDRMIAVMQAMGDTNPIHADEDLARSLGLRGIVNQGPANLAYVVNMLLAWAPVGSRIEDLRFRFHDNVVPGDQLLASGEVVSTAADGQAVRVDCIIRLASTAGHIWMSGSASVVSPEGGPSR